MALAVGEEMANSLAKKLMVDDTSTKKEAVRDEESEKDQVKVEEALKKEEAKPEKLPSEAGEELTEIEPKCGIAFPTKNHGLQLNAVGLRKKTVLAIGIKIYSFGMYADNKGLKEVLKTKIGEAPEKPTKDLYEAVIDCDVRVMVRLVIVFGGLTMNMVRKSFDESLRGRLGRD